MSDNNSLISLTCPNCQASLSCNSTEMTITCEHCGTSVLIKDFITKSHVNNDDKLQSYLTLAENAFNIKDWKNAYKYYESICKITKSEEDITIFNALGYICGKIEFQKEFAINCRKIELEKRILLLNEMKDYTEALKTQEIKKINEYNKNNNQKPLSKTNVYAKYNPILSTLYSEINETKPIKCSCGNVLICTDEECSKCGKSRQIVLKEIKTKKQLRNSVIFIILSIIFGAFAIKNLYLGGFSIFNTAAAVILLLKSTFTINKHLKNKTNKLFLPTIIIIPIILMILIGLCISPNKHTSTITETTESTINKKNKIPTEATTEMITENQFKLDVAVDFDENISYKINSNYSELEKTADSHSYFTGPPDWGELTISNISDSNYKYTNDDLIGFVEDLKTKEKITDYNYAKSDSFDYICAYGKGPINYYFIVNGNLYSVIFEHPSSDINDRTNFIESITVNKAGSAKEKPTELPTEKKNEPQTEEPTQEPTEELIESPTDEPTEEETEPEVITHDYVINYNTGKFHKPSCYTIKDAYNLGDYNGTKDELLDQGYAACKKCKPY